MITYQYSRLQRFQERCTAMINDPECHGDLLLVGFALAHDFLLYPKFDKNRSWREITDPLLLDSAHANDRIRGILRGDIRRYEMSTKGDLPWGGHGCPAPMQRREGLCGKRCTTVGSEVDPDTGERRMIGACSRADHQQWLKEHRRAHAALLADRIIPKPYANAGGVLARHFPNIQWDDVYRSIDPKWEAPPERDPADIVVGADEPRFKLILGDGEGGDGSSVRLESVGDGGLWSDR